jgi:hypothetical protein
MASNHIARMTVFSLFLLLMACTPKKEDGVVSFPCQTEDTVGVKRVLIMGDSISIGYSPFVIDELCAEGYFVTRIPTNGGDSHRTLASINTWLGSKRWDVVTFNNGLWDTAKSAGTPLGLYSIYILQIAERIKAHSNRAIFMTTTWVPEIAPSHDNETIDLYNSTAIDAFESSGLDIEVVDLNEESKWKETLTPINIHFITSVYKTFAIKIVDAILEGEI